MSAEMRLALDERSHLIEARARAVLDEALQAGDSWTRELGAPARRSVTTGWRLHACTVAAYRDRYSVVGLSAVGPAPQTVAQKRDAACAHAALESAKRLAEKADAFGTQGLGITAGPSPVRIQM
jgi:hypothetical protein